MNIFYYHIHIKGVPLPFNSADMIPCKFGSSPNQNTHNSFALLILSGSLLDWQPVEGLLRHAHKMSWLRADENDFSTGSSTGLAPHWLKTYFRHFKPHKSVCQKKKEFLFGKCKLFLKNLTVGIYPAMLKILSHTSKIIRNQWFTDHYLKKSPNTFQVKAWNSLGCTLANVTVDQWIRLV